VNDHEIEATDATLALAETLLDDLWTAKHLLERIDHFLEGIDQSDPLTSRIVARLLRRQIKEWGDA